MSTGLFYAPEKERILSQEYGVDLLSKIHFAGYGTSQSDHSTQLLKFNGENISFEKLFKEQFLLSKPKFIIFINGELNKDSATNYQKNNFKEIITDLIGRNDTWIIGAGLHVGVHELVNEVVRNHKLQYDIKNIFFIGINSWKYVMNSETISPDHTVYTKCNDDTPGKFPLDNHYDILLFNDIKDEEEISFQNKFVNYLSTLDAFSIQIVYGGHEKNLNFAYNYLRNSNIIVVIKGSGGIADVISRVMELNTINDEDVYNIIKTRYNDKEEVEKLKKYLSEMHKSYKTEIIIHDLQDMTSRLDEKIFDAMILKERDLNKRVAFSMLFNNELIDECKFLHNLEFTEEQMKEILKIILKNTKLKPFKILFPKIINANTLFQMKDLMELYEESIKSGIGCQPLISEKYLHLKFISKMKLKKNEDVEMKSCCYHLFIWALLSDLNGIARIIWEKCNEYVAFAFLGSITLKTIANEYDNRGISQLSLKCQKESEFYQSMAKEIISEAYDKDYVKAIKCLLKPLKIHDNMSALQIAIREKFIEFCNQSACQYFLNLAWQNDDLPKFDGEKYEKVVKKSFRKRIQSPKIKYTFHLISFIIFLLLFSYLNLVKLDIFSNYKIKRICLEIIIFIYISGFIVEEIQQIFSQAKGGKCSRLYAYYKGLGNKFDMITIIIAIISFILRFTVPNDKFMVIRCFYAVTLSMFIIKTLYFYLYFHSIGHKVIMIQRMIFDILFFLAIFVLFILAFGTLLQSLQYPNSEFSLSLLKDIFYRPYFQVYGELMIDTFQIPETCNTTNCKFQYSTIMVGFAIFLLLTNVLLLNLLIAMFNYTFQKDVTNRYSFLSIQLLQEYHYKTFFPSPLNIFSNVFFFVYSLLSKKKTSKVLENNNILGDYDKKEINELDIFEMSCTKSVLLKNKSSTSLTNESYNDLQFQLNQINRKLDNLLSNKARK